MEPQEKHRSQRLVALLIIGLCEAMKSETITIDEAENLMFSPHTIRCFNRMSMSPEIIDAILTGTELDAVKRIVSQQQFEKSLENIIAQASSFLCDTDPSDSQLDKWIEKIL